MEKNALLLQSLFTSCTDVEANMTCLEPFNEVQTPLHEVFLLQAFKYRLLLK